MYFFKVRFLNGVKKWDWFSFVPWLVPIRGSGGLVQKSLLFDFLRYDSHSVFPSRLGRDYPSRRPPPGHRPPGDVIPSRFEGTPSSPVAVKYRLSLNSRRRWRD